MNLIIVDDDDLIRKSLKLMLGKEEDINVLGDAGNGALALELCKEQKPDIILMDIRMPEMDGISAVRQIKQLLPDVKIMMLTTFDDKPNISQALAAGADGYLIKTDTSTDIAGKLRVLMDGSGVLGADVLRKLTAQENPALEKLTPRERDIARLVAQGLTNKEIAAQLFLSEGTVRNNLAIVMEKLSCTNRTQLGLAYFNY